jgi:hypothetical protein
VTIAPALRASFPNVPPNPPLEPQAEQQRLFEHTASFIAELAAHQPVPLDR